MNQAWRVGMVSIVTALYGAGPSVYADDGEKALTYLFTGMREERAAIRSGVCRIQGHKEVRCAKTAENDLSGEQAFFIAFDGQEKLRFDSSMPGRVLDDSILHPDPRDPSRLIPDSRLGTVVRRYCRSSKNTAFWETGTHHIACQSPQKPKFGYFDLRALGLYSAVPWNRGYDFETLLATYQRIKPLPSVDRSDPNVWLVTWTEGDEYSAAQWLIWVDVANGFAPVRLQQKERSRQPANARWNLVQDFQTQWAKRDGVWVPIHHEFALTPPEPSTQELESFDIVWESINHPVEEALFDYKSFDVPASVGVLDYSTGQAVELKPAVRAKPRIVPLPPGPLLSAQTWTRIVIGVGVACLGLVILLARWYRLRYLRLRSQEETLRKPTDSYTSQAASPAN